jgi:hypothetical protein
MPRIRIKTPGALPAGITDEVTEGVLKNLPGDGGPPSIENFYELPSVKTITKDLNDLNVRESSDLGFIPEEYSAKDIFTGNKYFDDMKKYFDGVVELEDLDDTTLEVIEEMQNTYKMSIDDMRSLVNKAIDD